MTNTLTSPVDVAKPQEKQEQAHGHGEEPRSLESILFIPFAVAFQLLMLILYFSFVDYSEVMCSKIVLF